MDSFRFDFRGNHETPGVWKQGGMDDDLEDIRRVNRGLSTISDEETFRTGRYQAVATFYVCGRTSRLVSYSSAKTDVLTIHGLSDKAVPSYDAIIYARALNERVPGTHNLHLMEDADHNFTGRQDEVVDIILEWWDKHAQRTLKTGIWMSGIRESS
ncbi:ectomycorrhiza-regulated esterase [Lentinula edodes]|uniref:Ectomycorrhiza-regulated esterase n=1 Tax=Lentinula edodes TaxID=5353 RepID=A0A1Q3EPX0_LENED|nr:ectomycorrhiza-regulated esterase [Lentinula edodes]